jgi:hypothetical protein
LFPGVEFRGVAAGGRWFWLFYVVVHERRKAFIASKSKGFCGGEAA